MIVIIKIARCFRDEDLRADRQPEFSQIDMEVSFMDENAIFELVESMVALLWKEILNQEISLPFQRMTHKEAMAKFGSDKPDLRFNLEIQSLKDVFQESSLNVFKQAETLCGLHVPQAALSFSRKDLEDLEKQATLFGATWTCLD